MITSVRLTRIILSIAVICLFLAPPNAMARKKQPEKNAVIEASGKVAQLRDHHRRVSARTMVSCFGATMCQLRDFIRDTRICALFVIRDGEVRAELFNHDREVCEEGGMNTIHKRYGIASVAKSLTSTWVGLMLADRYRFENKSQLRAALTLPVADYLSGEHRRALARSYAPVSLNDLLRMRSGVAWRESAYPRLFSDELLYARQVRERPSSKTVVEFASGYKRTKGAASFNYSALDASVAAVVAADLSGTGSFRGFQNSLWSKIGAENSAKWTTDTELVPIGSCCFRATVKDLARFGDFVLHKGYGRAPAAWFELATEQPKPNSRKIGAKDEDTSCALRYGFYWWLRPKSDDFTAFGRDGQFIHIYPATGTVIVQIADWQHHQDDPGWRCQALQMHDSLVRQIRD